MKNNNNRSSITIKISQENYNELIELCNELRIEDNDINKMIKILIKETKQRNDI